MRILMSALFASAAIAAGAAPAARPVDNSRNEARLAKMLDGRVAGTPVDCLPTSSFTDAQIVERTAIVYRVGATLYVNRPTSGRESLDDDDILVTRQVTPQLCSIDTVHLVDRTSGFPRGFVGLGQFVPYGRPHVKG